MVAVFQPCDVGVIKRTQGAAPCQPSSRPWVIAVASLGSGMAFLDSTVMNVALPAVQMSLQVSARQTQWVFGAFAVALAALLLIGGSLADQYGRKRVFILGAAIFGGASTWCALAPGPEQLIVARAVQGVGGALLVPASLAIVGASFEAGKSRAKAIGAWGALSATAMAVGPVLGGWLVEEISWRAALLISPAMAVVAIPIALWHVPESRDPKTHRPDLVGSVLATSGLGGLVYGLIESSAMGFGDPAVLAALIVGIVALSAFVFIERRSKDPMLPLSLFRSKNFDVANLVTLLFYMALTGSLYFLPFLMMQVHGYSALVTGSVFLPFVAMAFVIGRLSGRICARFGTKAPLVIASLAAAVGFVLFALPGVEHDSYWTSFFPAMVVQGFGMALIITPLTAVALGSVEGEHSGLASGVNNAAARVAAPLAVAVLGVLVYGAFSANLDSRLEGMNLSGEHRSELDAAKADLGAAQPPEGMEAGTAVQIERAIDESFVAGFRAVMLVCAGLALMSALAAAFLVEDRMVRSIRREHPRPRSDNRGALLVAPRDAARASEGVSTTRENVELTQRRE
ncbi:MAG TPA: DHA2 family efflux MFS transporter permease subunit [Rubrobacter sp.]|nr:DHA2 family efflux MFS transporter permease subunit [Rubrobacter sp.]